MDELFLSLNQKFMIPFTELIATVIDKFKSKSTEGYLLGLDDIRKNKLCCLLNKDIN